MESLNLTTLLLILFVICAVVVLLRGALRILSGCAVLAAAGWAALRVWSFCPEWSNRWFGAPLPWLSLVLPAVTLIVVVLLGRMIVRWITSPFRKSADDTPRPLTLGRLLGAAMLSIIPTCLLGTLVAVLILHAGEIEEMRQGNRSKPAKPFASLVMEWRKSLIAWVPVRWVRWFDPGFDPSRLPLAREIQRRSQQEFPPVIDPATGKPFPRAILVEDPALQELARDGSFSSLLRHPLLTRALQDPTLKSFLHAIQP